MSRRVLILWACVCLFAELGALCSELDQRKRQVREAEEKLQSLPRQSEEWRAAHGEWLRFRVALMDEMFRAGDVEQAASELADIENQLIPGEDATSRVAVYEARANAEIRWGGGWPKARSFLDQAERAAASDAGDDLPLLVLLARVEAANACQQYEEALATLKRLFAAVATSRLRVERAQVLKTQARAREALTFHYMGKLAASKASSLQGIAELAEYSLVDAKALEARLRSNLAATCLALDENAEAVQHAEASIAALSPTLLERAEREALASAYLTRATARCKISKDLAAKSIQTDLAASRRLYEQCYGERSASLVPLLTTISWIALEVKDIDGAEVGLTRAMRIAEANRMPPYFRIPLLENLCRLRLLQRRAEDARQIAANMRDIWKARFPIVMAAGTEADRINTLREVSWLDCAMAARSPQSASEDDSGAVDAILATYGAVFDSLLRDAGLIGRLPQDQKQRYFENRARLAALTLKVQNDNGSNAENEVSNLRRILRDMELLHGFDAQTEELRARLQSAMPKHSALVAYSPFRSMDGKAMERVAVAVVTSQVATVVQLPASRDSIRSEGDALLRAIANKEPSAEVQAIIAGLRDALWSPITGFLAGVERVYLCPDASMHRVPSVVWDHPDVSFLTSPQAILRKAPGHVEINHATAAWILVNASQGVVHFEPDLPFPYDVVNHLPEHSMPELPGTTKEVDGIEASLPERWFRLHSDTPTGAPEESAFIAALVDPPAVIHFAGHAVAHDPGVESSSAPSSWWEGIDQPRALWCSSLIFPNPQPAIHAEDLGTDNFLFAAEVAGLDLTGTQLVTLSACDTGAGISPKSEGHYSLARASHTAGVRDVLSATEAIPDGPTVDLMVLFYERLAKGEDAAIALWQEQRKLIKPDKPDTVRAFGFFRLTRAWVK
ncbi:MAG: CHAT domain-containing protein [Verrucomicrobiaceae bacterium]|nr:CHAT domain-containing protein [Verrucomicrobiaceae bacterium]